MKKLAILSVAALGLVPAAAVAADLPTPSSNYGLAAEMWAGANILGSSTGDANDGDEDPSFGILGGRASMIFGSDSDVMTQLSFEGQGNIIAASIGDDDQVAVTSQATAHILSNPGIGILGGGGVVSFQDDNSVNFFFGGLEYQAAFDGGKVLLQAGGLHSLVSDNGDQRTFQNAMFVQVAPEFITSDNLSLGLKAAYVTGDLEGGDRGELINWGVKLQQQFDNSPAAIFLAYDGSYVDGAGATFDEHSIVIGLRMALGDAASKEVVNPAVHQWVGLSQRTD